MDPGKEFLEKLGIQITGPGPPGPNQVPMPRSRPSPVGENSHPVIPIAVFMIIDAGTASYLEFHDTPRSVHDHAGIVFTSR